MPARGCHGALLELVDAVAVRRIDAALDDADQQIALRAIDQRAGRVGKRRRLRRVIRRRIEGDQLVVLVGDRRIQRVAHAVIHRQARGRPPRVLRVELEAVEAQVQIDVALGLGVGARRCRSRRHCRAGSSGTPWRRRSVATNANAALAAAGGVLVLLFEGREAAHLVGVLAALPREVVRDRVIDVLDAEQLVRAKQCSGR